MLSKIMNHASSLNALKQKYPIKLYVSSSLTAQAKKHNMINFVIFFKLYYGFTCYV